MAFWNRRASARNAGGIEARSGRNEHAEVGARRSFLGVTLASGLVVPVWAAACGNKEEDAAQRDADAARVKAEADAHDAELLNRGIALEQGAINVYKAAAGLPFIAADKAILGVAGLFMGQHEEHRDHLVRWVETLGGKAMDPATAPTPEIPKPILDASLSDDARKTAVLEFARSLEKAAADAYFGLISNNLRTDFARRSAAAILPVEAQHVALYDFVLGRAKPVNAALFTDQT